MGKDKMTDREIFEELLEIEGKDERRARLKQLCAGDARQEDNVLGLLDAHDSADGFLDTSIQNAQKLRPDMTPALPDGNEPFEKPGTLIGRYKLLEEIGSGGFGVVYMANQEEPVRRKVALKIIKPGMDTREVIARFEAERQALALMSHPNIAQVFDGGVTDSGRPYFVMELVNSIPITEFCDKARLEVNERLRLFITICKAIQHAHQKGIIHRDIKPSNVLVTLHGEDPVPKVIDFGIAKALDQELTEKTLFTSFGKIIGPPHYTSPEQASFSGLDIDTRSGIYSLGVLLYELLTGQTPLTRREISTATYNEMMRMIREKEPTRPSIAIIGSGETSATLAELRRSLPEDLISQVRGDLDWIVLKALEKDRDRRYETADQFASDIDNFLENKPVAAIPLSLAYLAEKF